MTKRASNPGWRTSFLAVVRYELLWNIRKKKILAVLIIAFVFATLGLVLPVLVSNLINMPIGTNPYYVITTGTGIGGFGFFLFALVSVMNTISGEFESGSIIPLLTKPVSRTTIYLGKIFAAFLTLLAAYVLLTIYMAAGGYVIYGPQNDMHLIVINLLASIVSTLVWMSIVLAIGSLSKSSLLAAILGLGIWFGLSITSGILSSLSDQAWILTYTPGNGALGTLGEPSPINQSIIATGSVTSGTDSIPSNLITYILHPTDEVTFYRTEFVPPASTRQILLYSEPLSLVVARSIGVAAVYILVFNFIAWYALKRAQVTE